MTTKPPNHDATEDVEPVLTLIKKIKEKSLNPAVLSAEDRRRCVDFFWGEGYGVAETAQVLGCGERTIFRDRSLLRSAHALHTHTQFPQQMAGELVRHSEISTARLRRIAREPNASAMERAMAEQFAFKVQLDTITKLQSMGYLPRVPTNVVAQVIGGESGGCIETFDRLAERLAQLEEVDRELGEDDPDRQKQRRQLEELIQRGRLTAEVEQLIHKLRPDEN